MASLTTATNVYNTCLRILRACGYKLWIEDGESELTPILWYAENDGYDFVADNPIELLGLVTIYEHKKPQNAPEPYWWSVEGEDIYGELFDKLCEEEK